MDDVDYLVEDNAMDDFCLSSEMDGTHGRTTFEDDPKQQLPRGQPMGIGTMAVHARNKMQMLGVFQPPYLPEIQIWLETGYFRLTCLKRRVATQIDEITLRDSREMNYDSKLQNMSWFCYIHVNTLSKTSMTT